MLARMKFLSPRSASERSTNALCRSPPESANGLCRSAPHDQRAPSSAAQQQPPNQWLFPRWRGEQEARGAAG